MTGRQKFFRSFGKCLSILTSITIILGAGLLPLSIQPTMAASVQTTLAVDGAAEGTCPNTTSSCSTTLSTQHGTDIIIAFIMEDLDLQTSCAFSVSDTLGLSWAARSGIVFDLTGRSQLQEFWARSLSPLSSDTVTESIAGCGNNYNKLIIFGVSGANFNTPFDPNLSLPSTALGYSGGTSVQVSTSNANDLIYAAVLHGDNTGSLTPELGFNIISPPSPTEAVESAVFGGTVTNSSVAFGDSAVDSWISIGDAVQAFSTAPDFSVTANPNVLTINAGSSSNSTIMVSSFNGLSGTISLTATVSPNTVNGPSPSLNPVSVILSSNESVTSMLTIKTFNSTQPETYSVTITGSNGTATRSAVVTVIVPTPPPADFSLTVSTSSVSLQAGASTNATISLASLNGFNGSVTLTTFVIGPGGLSATTMPSLVTLTPNGMAMSILTLNAGFPLYTPAGFTVIVSGASGFISHSIFVDVTVLAPPPDFTINTSPSSLTVIAGENQTVGIALFPTGGFNGSVVLTASISPVLANGPVVSVNPSVVQLFQRTGIIIVPGPVLFFSPVLIISTTSMTPPGNYTVTVTGTAGSITHSAAVSVQILPPPIIRINPTSGVPGTEVAVTGNGFPTAQQPFSYPVTIDVTFDDQFIGFTTTSNGAFSFTFNVPLAQPGQHTVKATTGFPTLTAATAFTVLPNQTPIVVGLTGGTVYFPGDTAVIYISTTSAGTPLGPANLQLQVSMIRPNGTSVSLTAVSISPGLYRATYAIPSNAPLGTYAVTVKAHEAGFQDGWAVASFEVKPSWIAANGRAVTMAVASSGPTATVAVGLVAWRRGYFRTKDGASSTFPF